MPRKVQLIASEDSGYYVQDLECFASIQIQNPGSPMLVLDRAPYGGSDGGGGHKFALYIDEHNDVRIQLVRGKELKDFSLYDLVTKLGV